MTEMICAGAGLAAGIVLGRKQLRRWKIANKRNQQQACCLQNVLNSDSRIWDRTYFAISSPLLKPSLSVI